MKRLLALLIGITLIMLLMAGCGGEKKEAFNWAGSDVTVDTVKKALEQKTPAKPVFSDTDFPQNITDVQVLDNVAKPGQKNILIYYKSGTVWDETDFVKRVGGTAIQVGSVLFTNPKIEQVALFAQTEMTDQYGKKSLEVGAKIVLSREIAEKVDWKGLADRHTADPANIYHLAKDYYIHPGILRNVKLDKVKL
ncbi:hypothetical protein [Desulfurispora thermophila]|uniref:hypothetical protein n=1 Tax=Desulfurispora thermophila TaxID=265470 RepID=UPI00036529CD|nr:hypothetical protein [Desulfurispora thermophila]